MQNDVHLRRPRVIKVSLVSLLIFLVITIPAEFLLRSISPHATPYDVSLANPLLNTRYAPVIEKLTEFKELISHEFVDCILVGSSLAEYIDPDLVAEQYYIQTGKVIHCYNFALLDASASTTAKLVSLLEEDYDGLKLVVWGIQAHSFFSDPDSNENLFSESDWVRYYLGTFNLAGWFHDQSYLYRFLDTYMPLLLFPNSLNEVNPPGKTERNRNTLKGPEIHGYHPLLAYKDSAPLLQPTEQDVVHYLPSLDIPSAEDWKAIDQLNKLAKQKGFQLILVNIPTNDPDGASKPFMNWVKEYARNAGVLYLSTENVQMSSSTFSDTVISTRHRFVHNHFHISGTLVFSQWLGKQLGQAEVAGAFEQVNNPIWTPGIETLEMPYQDTRGLTATDYQRYLDYASQFNLIPSDALIYNPSPEPLEPLVLQTSLGLLLEWQTDVSPQQEQNDFELITLFERMRYRDDLDLTPSQLTQFDSWYTFPDPAILHAAGIEYILCRQEPGIGAPEHCPASIRGNPAYKMMGQWNYEPMLEQYTLYTIYQG